MAKGAEIPPAIVHAPFSLTGGYPRLMLRTRQSFESLPSTVYRSHGVQVQAAMAWLVSLG